MSSHAAPRRTTRRRLWFSARLRAALSLGVVLGIGSVGTFAYWTDTVTVTGTTFTAGTLDLLVNDDADDAVAFTTMNFALVPGSTVAGVLTVKNEGKVPLKYTASSAATNADGKNLVGSLTAKVTGAASVTGTAPSATCGGTALAGSGTSFTADLVPVGSGRLLAPDVSESFCIQATLSASAPSSLQGGTTDVTFTFTGTSDLS